MKYNENKYYYDGYAAHTNNCPLDSCPLIAGTHSNVSWHQGWRDAEYDSRKKSSLQDSENANQQFESLAAKPIAVWSGDGLPPVGTECEWRAGDHNWIGVKVLAYHEDEAWIQPLNGAESFTVGDPDDFRPIRTEAERKRDEAIAAMRESLGHAAGLIEVANIYRAIAAGKIPHIKLESPHE